MKLQIVIDRDAGFRAVALLMAESTDAGFVPVGTTELHSAEFSGVMRGWQALSGLLANTKPRSRDDTVGLLARFHAVTPTPIHEVIWTGGG